MDRTLSPADVPRRDPAAQAVELPDGRLLVRHARGLTLLAGVPAADLARVLAEVDGERTAAEVGAALAGEYEEEDVQRLLASLLGEMVHAGAAVPAPAGNVHLLAGNGESGRRLAEALSGMGLTPRTGDPAPPGAADLLVCALEQTSYERLLEVQRSCLEAGIPALFLTLDPDGIRVGPAAVPGLSPCLACAQLAAFRSLRLEPAQLLAAAGRFATGQGLPPGFDRAAAALAAEARELLRDGGTPSLLTHLLQVAPDGTLRKLPVERAPDCPLCGALAPPPAARTGVLVAEELEQRPARALAGDPEGLVASVGILGGGTAGYLAALALRRKLPHLAVTLLESPDLPVIGVGEATTPLMPQFLHVDLGLDVHRLFREVRPTFKLGIRFLWGAPGAGDFHYPFGPVRVLEPLVHGGDLRDCSLQSLLMSAGAVPLYPRRADTGWASHLGTAAAYHLDNQRFVAYLRRRAAEAGVARIEATISGVEKSADGEEVRALLTADGRRLAFDLYVDCSGFRSLLLEGALGSPWVGFESSLWTDRAVVAPVPHGGSVRPYTTAETMSAGWCWSTPQADADHRGYVFASAFQTPEEAEEEMRRANPGMGEARLVRFRAGRHRHFVRGNVVALGNAYGFVEPLESTALHLLIRQIGLLVQAFPWRRGERGLAAVLDRKVAGWWDYLRWFLALHYRFNRRLDTPFWRACYEEVDVSAHEEILTAFRERGPLSYDRAARTAFDYPDPLWGPEGIDVLLLGQGVPAPLPRPALDRRAWDDRLRLARAAAAQAARHELALDLLAERPELLESFAAAFRAAGPAFPAGVAGVAV